MAQDNIFKSEAELDAGVDAGLYDKAQVEKLKANLSDSEFKRNEDIYKFKQQRLAKQGLDISNYNFSGQKIYKFTEMVLESDGERVYLLFDYYTSTWIRAEKFKDVFESRMYHWVSWATHEDAFNFWSKAPCDDMRPVSDAMDTLFNQELDNRYKINFSQRAYDPKIFTDPAEQLS